MKSRTPGSGLPPALKRLGQHFLTDKGILERIVEAMDIEVGDTVVEVGPGRGSLTDLLVPRAARLVAIEIDRALVPVLRQRYAESPHVEIVESDVLKVDLAALARGPYVLVGNVPYYITTPIIFHALVSPRPRRAVFLVQREVAERIIAAPGDEAYGALSVNVQALADAQIVARVPASAFKPRPTVDSAILRLTPKVDPLVRPGEEAVLQKFVQGAFGQRRRQMRRVLRTVRNVDGAGADAALDASGIDPSARPETLSAEAFIRLLRALPDVEST
jgi:16S rRNA (adenine1518-N6/adenine1519-N6)-dimethyltransferase